MNASASQRKNMWDSHLPAVGTLERREALSPGCSVSGQNLTEWHGKWEGNYYEKRPWNEGCSLLYIQGQILLSTCTLPVAESRPYILGSHPRKGWASLCALRPSSTRPALRGERTQPGQSTRQPSGKGPECPFQFQTEWEGGRAPS